MIIKKEFYFVRHGQTDHNAYRIFNDPSDISLNDHGRKQATVIAPIVAMQPLKTICFSPLKRAKETKSIVASNLLLEEHEVEDLRECDCGIWDAMTALGNQAHLKSSGSVQDFMEQVRRGVNQALAKPGPVLIVAHGGVHWALCCWMGVDHEWEIDNCIPVHFTFDDKAGWLARKLS